MAHGTTTLDNANIKLWDNQYLDNVLHEFEKY
jgi:hypothetical protein